MPAPLPAATVPAAPVETTLWIALGSTILRGTIAYRPDSMSLLVKATEAPAGWDHSTVALCLASALVDGRIKTPAPLPGLVHAAIAEGRARHASSRVMPYHALVLLRE